MLGNGFAVAEDALTKATWENMTWDLTGDKFGAAVVDPTLWKVDDNAMLTNYVFTQVDGAYKTTSQMVEGTYMFYTYPGFEKKDGREPIKFDITSQEVTDLKNNPTEPVLANQVFFSPLFQIAKENKDEDGKMLPLPLEFHPLYSTAAFIIKNTTEQTLTLNQIVMNGSFLASGAIKPTSIQKNSLVYSVKEDADEYTLPNKKDGTPVFTASNTKENTLLTAGVTSETSTSMLVLNCNDYELAVGEEITAYMAVPVGAQTNLTVDLIVTDENGEAKKVQVRETEGNETIKDIASKGISKLTFKRDRTMSVFGWNTSGTAPKGISIAKKNLGASEGFFISSKQAFLDLINKSRGAVTVYNIGDWGIDAEVAKAIEEYTGAGVTFTNPIAIEDEAAEVALTKATFKKVTIAEGTVGEFAVNAENLEIEAGADVTLTSGQITDICNHGVLAIAENVTTVSVKNDGGLTITGREHNVTMNGGSLAYYAAKNASNKNIALTISTDKLTLTLDAEDINVTIGEDVTLDVAAETYIETGENATVTLTNYGAISTEKGKLTVYGVLENYGEIEGEKLLAIYGKMTNYADAEVKTKYFGVRPGSTLNNDGIVKATAVMNNEGTIVLGTNSQTTVTKGKGLIDNSKKVRKLDVNEDQTVYYTFEENVTSADVNALDCEKYSINKLVFAKKLTIDVDEDNKVTEGTIVSNGITKANGVNTIELQGALEVEDDVKGQTLNITSLIINGDVTASGFSWGDAKSGVAFSKNATMTVKAGKTLTVEELTITVLSGVTLTIASETDEDDDEVFGKVVNNGTIQVGTSGVAYAEGDNCPWWSGNAAETSAYSAN